MSLAQKAIQNARNLSSKWAPLKWGLALIKRKSGLIHRFLFRFICFQQRFVLDLTEDSDIHIFAFTQTLEWQQWHSCKCCMASKFWICNVFIIIVTTIYYLSSNIQYRTNLLLLYKALADWTGGTAEAPYQQATMRPSSPSTPTLRVLLEYQTFRNWNTKNVLNKKIHMHIIANRHKICATILLTLGR